MSYAIRKDAPNSVRSINGPEEVLVEEYFSATLPLLVPVLQTRAEVEALRLRAYADPISGSDRYFAEAARVQAMGGTEEEVEAARSAGAARSAEIQALYPWPE